MDGIMRRAIRSRHSSAFTIVELLIVIVIIGILAALVVVAYNGIQSRARASAASSALTQAAKKIALWQVDNPSTSPPDLTTAGVTNTDSVSYQYTAGSNGAYCITATVGTTSYYLNTTTATKPTEGGCSGHGQGGIQPITNLATNPSFETNTNGGGGVNGATFSRQAMSALTGSYGVRVSAPANGIGDSGANLGGLVSVTNGKVYTYALSIKAITAGTYNTYVTGNSGNTGNRVYITLAANQTGVLRITQTAVGTGLATWYVLRGSGSVATDYDIDSIIVTESSSQYNYADGDSPNWTWNNTPHNSTSTGPPL